MYETYDDDGGFHILEDAEMMDYIESQAIKGNQNPYFNMVVNDFDWDDED
jgi:hypothetical protein